MPDIQQPKPEQQPQQPEIKAKIRKKSLGQKVLNTFLVDDIPTTISNIWTRVVIPKVRDIITAAVDTAFLGAPQSRSGVSSGTNYNALSQPQTQQPQSSLNNRMLVSSVTSDIMLYSEADVLRMYDILLEKIREDGFVSVNFLYQLLKLPHDHTKENWGWYSIPTRTYTKSYDADGKMVFCPVLPKPTQLVTRKGY